MPFLGTVPLDPAIVESGDAGTPIVISAPESAPAAAFRQIARALAARTAGEAPAAGEQPSWLNKLRGHLGQ